MSLTITAEPFDSVDARRLIAELDAGLAALYPPEQRFGGNLKPEHLEAGAGGRGGTFLVAREDGRAVGCGAYRLLDSATAELKRMYVEPGQRGRGVGAAVLAALEAAAGQQGVRRLVLETGVHQQAAIGLYRRAGFAETECWGEYAASPTSVCFEKAIEPPDVITELLSNNRDYQHSFHSANLPTAPRRQLAIVTCMDSRIDLFAVLGLENGEAHIIRNAGGIVTEDVVRSLTLSRWLLGTRHIFVIQHTRCGLHGLDEDGLRARLQASGLEIPFGLGHFDDVADSVRQSMRLLRDNPLLVGGTVRGAVYDVDTGVLQEVEAS